MNAAATIVQVCDADPPKNVDPHPRLFDDLDDDRLSSALFKLWQKGVLDAEWDEEEEGTDWWLTEFGVELEERGLTRQYIEALTRDIQIDTSPTVLEADLR